MKNYLKYLQSIQNPVNFSRKIEYIKYNFGTIISKYKSPKVLEIGPGIGELISYLNSIKINNIDIIDNDIYTTKYINKTYKINNNFTTENIASIDNKLGHYDLIFLTQVLEHFPINEHHKLITTIYKHLNPKGKIIITVPNGGNPLNITERYYDITHYLAFTDNSLQQLPHAHGLINYKVETKGFEVPSTTIFYIFRKVLQKILHVLIKVLIIINGGIFCKTMTPNITLIITKTK